jgi:chromosome partitioning protein
MKKVAIISQKGGAGKTTLALHLAVAASSAGETCLALDLDPQASAAAWKDLRKAETPDVLSVAPGRFVKALEAAESAGVTLALVDTAPHSQDVSFTAAQRSDLVLVPCRHGFLDISAISTTAQLVKAAGKPAFVICNHLPPTGRHVAEDVTNAVGEFGLRTAPVVIHQRASYGHALTLGETAQEFEPDGKAAKEISALYAWLRKTLKELDRNARSSISGSGHTP